MARIKRLLVANRGEIAIRVFRAATELGIETIGIYSYEDRYSLHRYKSDESYLIGKGKDPIQAYLSMDEIIDLAIKKHIDAIHPGYGFLSENAEFARKCEANGIIFIGPEYNVMEAFGDKMRSKELAEESGIPVIPGSRGNINSFEELKSFTDDFSFPIIVKATKGGGGRGMRIVNSKDELETAYNMAKSEALKSFGNDDIIAEKVIENPKHIEIQILADKFGNVVHLFERDCSIQRRHQKMIEIAPSINMPDKLLNAMYKDAIKFAKYTHLTNAATFEFLVDENKEHYYFLEVNPRLQVEHTITELITGIDIVQAQIRIAQNEKLMDIVGTQENIMKRGFAIQCRITTEDPQNDFLPHAGRIDAYRSPVGFGIRLDAGSAYTGAIISPYYDSLLVKISSFGLKFEEAAKKMNRALREFRVRGVKTNIKFLENVMINPDFISGNFNVNFLDTHPELFEFKKSKDRATKIVKFLGNNVVNHPYGELPADKVLPSVEEPIVNFDDRIPEGSRDIFARRGLEGVINWIKSSKEVLFCDTTFRDAHQSLLATRVRMKDMLDIADYVARYENKLFSIEMWGGATFDVAYRFLKEDPWVRVERLKEKIPNILFQMLLRGSNAVGYTNYPDNVVRSFILEAANAGIDVFRIFDCLNWTEQMKIPMEEVKKLGKVCEPAICYTGNILDEKSDKYTLNYYVNLAKELEKMGADIIAIKDMAGLVKPYASKKLFKALKEEIGVPIHFHTHDTSGNGEAAVLCAVESGVDIVDVAISSMSGLTSQPSMNSIIAALNNTDKASSMDRSKLETIANYWEKVREYYFMFESGLKGPTAEVYDHEIPGGQYSNLKPQVASMGLLDRWEDIKKMYADVNRALGNIIKVTPSSKVVGDLALFLVRNNLSVEDFKRDADKLSLPQSVIDYFKGYLGQPYGGFDETLRKKVLKDEEPINVRPGELLKEFDFDKAKEDLKDICNGDIKQRDLVSYALYDKVFKDYQLFIKEYGDVSILPTKDFFFPLKRGEETVVDIEDGKTLFVKFLSAGNVNDKGFRRLTFTVNGETRFVDIKDETAAKSIIQNEKGDKTNPKHIIATMPGSIVKIQVSEKEVVKKNQVVAITEAMKMETKIVTITNGKVKRILLKEGDAIEDGDLIMELE